MDWTCAENTRVKNIIQPLKGENPKVDLGKMAKSY